MQNKKNISLLIIVMLFTVVKVQGQYGFSVYRSPDLNIYPKGQQQPTKNSQNVRVSGYYKSSYSNSYSRMSIIVEITNPGENNESLKVVKIQDNNDSWQNVNCWAELCRNECQSKYYASINGGYVYFDL